MSLSPAPAWTVPADGRVISISRRSAVSCYRPRPKTRALSIALLVYWWSSAAMAVIQPPAGDSCAELDQSAYPQHKAANEDGYRKRCDLVTELKQLGVSLPDAQQGGIMREIIKPYLTVYDINGGVPISRIVVDYLIRHAPSTARLINFYNPTDYQVVFLHPDQRGFFAINQDRFHASFNYLHYQVSEVSSDYVFYQTGQARLLFWRVWGNMIVEFELSDPDQAETHYQATAYAFANSRVLHLLISSRLFRYLADSIFKEVITDIVTAVEKFKDDQLPRPESTPFHHGLLERLHDRPKAATASD